MGALAKAERIDDKPDPWQDSEMTNTATPQFTERLSQTAGSVAAFLDARLSAGNTSDRFAWPDKLRAAMRHGVLNGGKRLRPFLVMETARLLGGNANSALFIAASLECIHCYSLIHDDLPAMDDDELRRGQPTVHVAFDEATAILAGDALLTLAFELVADPDHELAPQARVELVRRLARAAGAGGMVGGQVLDIVAENSQPTEAEILKLQSMKTGALLRFGCEAGAVVADADEKTIATMSAFGDKIGLAFQLADDLLDATSDAKTVGKATGKDAGRNKGTYLSINGLEATKARCDEMVNEAIALLAPFGHEAEILKAAAIYVSQRDK